jgi:transcriptional regulator with GAF, ATPase, and Fis domain
MVDWDVCAVDPVVRYLTGVLHKKCRVWVGFIGDDGQSVPVPSGNARPVGVCQHFLANALPMGPRSRSVRTCQKSVDRWVDRDRQAGRPDPHKSCHAGLHAISLPIEIDGTFCGSVYVSGYLPSERHENLLAKLRDRIDEEAFGGRVSEEDLIDVPKLSRIERSFVATIAESIRERVIELRSSTATDPAPVSGFGGMIGNSPEMKRLFAVLKKVAPSDSSILIQGENGTGKELIATAIHRHSRRKEEPFVVQNCAAIPSELIASELFGHKKGAFSGAHRDRIGLFELANHGTFFLDEIGDMDLTLQTKLLRVLQEGTFLPVGDNVFRKVNVRVICATNRDLRTMVKDGTFRQDLYYRINVISVTAPPLRHRPGDIIVLARHFLKRAARVHGRAAPTLTPDAIAELQDYPWPGNVRQLDNEMERAVVMAGTETEIDASALRLSVRTRGDTDIRQVSGSSLNLPEAVSRLEEQMILEALRRHGWNKSRASKTLGVSRRNLIRKVAHFNLDKDD